MTLRKEMCWVLKAVHGCWNHKNGGADTRTAQRAQGIYRSESEALAPRSFGATDLMRMCGTATMFELAKIGIFLLCPITPGSFKFGHEVGSSVRSLLPHYPTY